MQVNYRQLGTNGLIHITELPTLANRYKGKTTFCGTPKQFKHWNRCQGHRYEW